MPNDSLRADAQTMPRRLFLRAGIASAVFPALHAAASVDPIFAAIEQHKAALAAYSASLNAVDSVWARQHNYETTQADMDANDQASDAERHAMVVLANTSPTTLAGFRAIFTYVRDCEVSLMDEDVNDFLQSFLGSPLLKVEA